MALHFASCCNIQYNQIVNYLNVLELDPFRPKLSIKCQRWVRISSTGNRFWVEDATIWNLLDEKGIYCGQAAVFYKWSDL
ncbi:MAG: MEKHLA domain-containing protein [Proteobacteria bacterium]|nr:MEKHLA domain-containing protein [Pseudomonadota bacterium]